VWEPGFIFGGLSAVLVGIALLGHIRLGAGSSQVLCLACWLFARAVTQIAQPFVYDLCVEHRPYSFVIWYTTWVLIDFLAILVIYGMHKAGRVKASALALFISASFLMSIAIQVVGFIDRAVLETRAFDDLYRYLILSVNFLVGPVAIIELVKFYFVRKKEFSDD
jgi:hypothetical protein